MQLKINIKHESFWQAGLFFINSAFVGYLLTDMSFNGFHTAHLVVALLVVFNIYLIILIRGFRLRPAQEIIQGEDPRMVRELESRNQNLQLQVELLTALREMSRVVSDCLDFKDMIQKVFVILDGLLNAESISLFIPDDTGEFLPAACKKKQDIHFWTDINNADFTNVFEAAENRCTLRVLENDRLHLVTPLVSDTEFIGVLSLELKLFGDSEIRLRETERYESILMEMIKHIALVIKTDNLHTQGIQDGLTGLYSKRHFLAELEKSYSHSCRNQTALSLIMVDIDHFKKVNDNFGHLTGDMVLKGVSKLLQMQLRDDDTAFRFGGEELAVILKNSDINTAFQVAERIRKRVGKEVFKAENGKTLKITLSLGVSSFQGSMKNALDLVGDADKALYLCKEKGRNQSRKSLRKALSKQK
jgi:diguanylate cyclase (GGDEF)-like protein